MITKRCTNLFKVSYPSERSEFRCIFSSQPNVSHLLVVNRRHFTSISPTITDLNSIVSRKELVAMLLLKTLFISQSTSRSLSGPSCHFSRRLFSTWHMLCFSFVSDVSNESRVSIHTIGDRLDSTVGELDGILTVRSRAVTGLVLLEVLRT